MGYREELSDEEFEKYALDILKRELGLDGFARFLRLYRSGSGDYTRDRHRWLDSASIADIVHDGGRRDPSPS